MIIKHQYKFFDPEYSVIRVKIVQILIFAILVLAGILITQSQQDNVSDSTKLVTSFVKTFSNQSTSSYSDSLKGFGSQKVINELTQTFAPSVTFSDKAHYDVPIVAFKMLWVLI